MQRIIYRDLGTAIETAHVTTGRKKTKMRRCNDLDLDIRELMAEVSLHSYHSGLREKFLQLRESEANDVPISSHI